VFVAFIVDKDTNHDKAVSLMKEIVNGKHGPAITSKYLFDETVTVALVSSKSSDSAVTTGNLIKESMPVLDVDSNTFEGSWTKFKNQNNKITNFKKYGFDPLLIFTVRYYYGYDLLYTCFI